MILAATTIWMTISIASLVLNEPAPPAAPAACESKSFSANVAADARAIAAAGVKLASKARLVSAVRVAASCDADVIGVFSGGVTTKSGEEWELRPEGARNLGGGASAAPGDPCSGSTFKKCLKLPGTDAYVALDRARAGQSVRRVSTSGQSKILSTSGPARIVDIAYLAAPDAPGGRMTSYVHSRAGNFLIVVETD